MAKAKEKAIVTEEKREATESISDLSKAHPAFEELWSRADTSAGECGG